MKITRVGGRISRDRLPPGGQPVHGWLTPRGATCPGGKINWDTGSRSAIGRAPDWYVRGPGFDTRSGNILSFLLPLFQEGQLSVTGESMCKKYWLTA